MCLTWSHEEQQQRRGRADDELETRWCYNKTKSRDILELTIIMTSFPGQS